MTSFNEQFNAVMKATLLGKQKLHNSTYNDENLQVMDESSESQDFFGDNNNNSIGKRYTATRIKSRNFLSNIAYVGINKEDYYNENFVFDAYLLITENL